MNKLEKIRLVSIVGHGICIDSEDGERVYDLILKALREDKNVEISFEGVEDVTSLFLNAAIGQLYDPRLGFSEELRNRLSVTDISRQDSLTLKHSVDRAKEYYKDPERFHSATDEILGEDDE